jgi:malonyl-CoA O-methyltransferase
MQTLKEFCNQHNMASSKGFFVTATDTNIGKSYCSALLMQVLNAHYFKPIQAGDLDIGGDTALVQKLSKMPDDYFFKPIYNLKYPLSPHEAAQKQGITIDIQTISLPICTSPIIVEGAGGVLVPLNDTDFMIDLIDKFALPVILVVRTALGTLNHSLLTIQALKARNIPIKAIIMNGDYMPNNYKSLKQFSGIDAVFCNQWQDKGIGNIL